MWAVPVGPWTWFVVTVYPAKELPELDPELLDDLPPDELELLDELLEDFPPDELELLLDEPPPDELELLLEELPLPPASLSNGSLATLLHAAAAHRRPTFPTRASPRASIIIDSFDLDAHRSTRAGRTPGAALVVPLLARPGSPILPRNAGASSATTRCCGHEAGPISCSLRRRRRTATRQTL
jgi:hypothetical protein